MELTTVLESGLPRLAWLGVIDFGCDRTTVLHGASVEVTDRFVVEGAWAGAFADAGFAESEAFFGSGLKVVSRGIIVSPSRALVDRVFSCETEWGLVVANSLPLLLFGTGGTLAPERSYERETYTILRGIQEYDPVIPTRGSKLRHVRQHYYHPFLVTRSGLHTIQPSDPPQFQDYRSYVSFLDGVVGDVLRNSRDSDRTASLVPRLTLSRGYDSPAVAVLASRFVSPLVYTAPRSNSLVPDWIDREATLDDGEPIAGRLGLSVRRLKPGPPDLDERLFLAGGAGNAELVFGILASDALSDTRPTLLLTGYHGDKVWARDPGRAYVTPELRRGDISGLALSEVRLWAGFINVAVPFIGARGIESIVQISKSAEMKPWSIGGEYDRPIARRMVEEAGIPREWFGHRKRAVLQAYSVPCTAALRRTFGHWLEAEQGITLDRYRFLVQANLIRWASLRATQKLLAGARLPAREPARWTWIPGGNPASLLYRWAVTELTGSASPFPSEVRTRVRTRVASPSA